MVNWTRTNSRRTVTELARDVRRYMRLSADWMTIADERVLEFLAEEGPHSPSKIAGDERVHFTSEYVGRRCRKLADNGLTRNVGNGVYAITEEGEWYLAGELDAGELTADGE